MNLKTFAGGSALFAIGWLASCSVANAPDDPIPADDDTSTSSSGGSGGSGNAGGNGGGGSGAAECGDSVVDSSAGETCDPPSSCPDCDDLDACTVDTMTGSPASCDVTCDNAPITACLAESDGCCPAGCNGMNDIDCAVCNNGVIELGETCDGNCPTVCPVDDNLCTSDQLLGDPNLCTAQCMTAPITTCAAQSDACCPSGCSAVNDADCGQSVLILHNASAAHVQDVQTNIQGLNLFSVVDLHDADGNGAPTLDQLKTYDVVLAFSGGSWDAPDPVGNVLADYYDGGGRVVTATFSTCNNGTLKIGGRWGDLAQGYMLLAGGTQAQPSGSLGTIVQPGDMLMTGVQNLTATSAFRCPGTAANGGVVIAEWNNGDPLIVRGMVQNRPRVYLNFYPPSKNTNSAYWSGDGVNLLRNALLLQ